MLNTKHYECKTLTEKKKRKHDTDKQQNQIKNVYKQCIQQLKTWQHRQKQNLTQIKCHYNLLKC